MSLGIFFCHPHYSCFLYKVCCCLRQGKLGVAQGYGGTPSFQGHLLAQKKNKTVLQMSLLRKPGFASFALDPSSCRGPLLFSGAQVLLALVL